MLIIIDGRKLSVSGGSQWAGVGEDGTTIYRRGSGVTMGALFATVGISADNECIAGRSDNKLCTNEIQTLRYYVNGEQLGASMSLNEYVFADQDRILVIYSHFTSDHISDFYIPILDGQIITRTDLPRHTSSAHRIQETIP